MSSFRKHLLTLTAFTAVFGGAAEAQRKPMVRRPAAPAAATVDGCVTKFTADDWSILLANIAAGNTDLVKRLQADPELRAGQVANLRELFAIGCQAVKDGVAKDPLYHSELDNIRSEVAAAEYERTTVKPPPAQPLSSVPDTRVAVFYKTAGNEARFDNFLKVKIELLSRVNPEVAAQAISDEERLLARTAFAQISLLAADSDRPAARADSSLRKRIALQVKLQLAQFLARTLTDSFGDKFKASDAEIEKYLAGHPELSTVGAKAKAEGILKRAVAGEDFAALANQYSEDPGNISADGEQQGGIYTDVPKGKMVPEFERTAVALDAGTVSAALTQTDYGFHIIKLERKGERGGTFTYDVRHILILTQLTDPDDPNSRPMPAAEFARRRIERQRAEELKAKIIKDNPIDMADFPTGETVPAKKATPARK